MLRKLMLSLFLVAIFLGTVSPAISYIVPNAYSQSDLGENESLPVDEWINLEAVNGFIEYCLDEFNPTNRLYLIDLNEGKVYNDSGSAKAMRVSPNYGDDNNSTNCYEVAKSAMIALYGDYRSYRSAFYNSSKIKEEYCNSKLSELGNCVKNSGASQDVNGGKFRAALRDKAEEKGLFRDGNPIVGESYEFQTLRPLFEKCFRTSSNGFSIQDGKYAYESNIDGADEVINVGLLIDGGNGQWNCGEMRNFVNTDRWAFVELTDAEFIERENRIKSDELSAQKYTSIIEIFRSDPNLFNFCTSSLLTKYDQTTDLRGKSPEDKMNYVALWMASYTSGTANGTVPWTDEEGEEMIKCLVNENVFGQELSDILAVEADYNDPTALDAPAGTQNAEEPEVCQGSEGFSLANWLDFIICPVTQFIFAVVGFIEDNFIVPYLSVSPLDDNGPIYGLWKAMRNISYIFLILAFMFLVFSETTSFGGEAYQLKRLAPRLVIATIGITLSYTLVGWVIDFFNILGVGIAQLTAWALSQTGANALVTVDGSGLVAFMVSSGATVLAGAVAISKGAAFLGVAALTGVLIIFAVLVTLIIRQVIILAAVILAPLAAVAWLLPNTEKFFKLWWSYLSKALVMYPLIMLLFAAGKIFGAIIPANEVVGDAGLTAGVLKSMTGFLANVAPLAMIPFTFKFAGGAIGGLYGALRGGTSKAYNAMMGDPRDPNSIRGRGNYKSRNRRDILGQKFAQRVSGGKGGDSFRGKVGGRLEQFGRFSERLAQQQKEREGITQALAAIDSGDGLAYAIDGGVGIVGGDLNGEARFGKERWAQLKQKEANGTLTDSEKNDMESVRQFKKGIPPEHMAWAQSVKNAPFDQQKHLLQMWAQKSGGSPARAASAAAYIQNLRDNGSVNERQARELDRAYMKAVAPNGGMFLKHIEESMGESGGGGWRQAILAHPEGMDGILREQARPTYNDDGTLNRQSQAYKTLQKIGGEDTGPIGEMDVDFMSSWVSARMETDPGTGEQVLNVDKLEPEERRMVAGFMERADINDYYRQRMDTDTRNKLYGGEGYVDQNGRAIPGLVQTRVIGKSQLKSVPETVDVYEADGVTPKLTDDGRQVKRQVVRNGRAVTKPAKMETLHDLAPERGRRGQMPDPDFFEPPEEG